MRVEPAVDADDCRPTPLTGDELAAALREGHVRRFGVPPNPDRWACAWAHCAFEQARGAAVFANNIGHVTVRPGTPHEQGVCRRRFRERVRRDPDVWELQETWFPAFDTPADGAAAYWALLVQGYYSVIERCDRPDAREAARRLGELGYFTGPEEPYVDGMARLFVHARGVVIPRLIEAGAR